MKKDYEAVLKEIKHMDQYELKRAIFLMSEQQIDDVKALDLDAEQEKVVTDIIKNRVCVEFLLINAFVKTQIDVIDF